jgi:hypothetical protein
VAIDLSHFTPLDTRLSTRNLETTISFETGICENSTRESGEPARNVEQQPLDGWNGCILNVGDLAERRGIVSAISEQREETETYVCERLAKGRLEPGRRYPRNSMIVTAEISPREAMAIMRGSARERLIKFEVRRTLSFKGSKLRGYRRGTQSSPSEPFCEYS